jgi:hypothetical protein
MTPEQYHNIFMTNAKCCYASKGYSIACKLQLGLNISEQELYKFKLLYLLTTTFGNYLPNNCVSIDNYNSIYFAIKDICNFCNHSPTFEE